MCSIIGGFNSEKFKELISINQHRGNFSYSFTDFLDNKIVSQIKGFGLFPEDLEAINSELFKVGHVQAPTGHLVKDRDRIHPVMNETSMLWHNGIITPRGIRFLQQELNSKDEFDTRLLFKFLEVKEFKELSNIEGLFACLYYKNGSFYIFRTKHAKIYIDKDMNISSEHFEGSACLPYDTIYEIDLANKKLKAIDNFKTKRYNIIINGDDLSDLIKP